MSKSTFTRSTPGALTRLGLIMKQAAQGWSLVEHDAVFGETSGGDDDLDRALAAIQASGVRRDSEIELKIYNSASAFAASAVSQGGLTQEEHTARVHALRDALIARGYHKVTLNPIGPNYLNLARDRLDKADR